MPPYARVSAQTADGRLGGPDHAAVTANKRLTAVPMVQCAIRQFLAGARPVRADERCSHAVHYRGGNVTGEVVADEQHLPGGTSGRRQHQVVEEGVRLADAERV